MTSILLLNDEEANGKIDIDELYDKNLKRDLKQLSVFNKILGRIHKRITLTAKNKRNDKYIWFLIPEFIFGEPTYDQTDCIAYIVNKISENGFYVKYIHPNTLFISWEQWVPSYVRTEIKKKTGKVIDEKGQIINNSTNMDNVDSKLFNMNNSVNGSMNNNNIEENHEKNQKQFTPIDKYKPSGKLVYDPDYFAKLQNKCG